MTGEKFFQILSGMTPEQRAKVVFIGDMLYASELATWARERAEHARKHPEDYRNPRQVVDDLEDLAGSEDACFEEVRNWVDQQTYLNDDESPYQRIVDGIVADAECL